MNSLYLVGSNKTDPAFLSEGMEPERHSAASLQIMKETDQQGSHYGCYCDLCPAFSYFEPFKWGPESLNEVQAKHLGTGNGSYGWLDGGGAASHVALGLGVGVCVWQCGSVCLWSGWGGGKGCVRM